MIEKLDYIFELESTKKYNEAYDLYQKRILKNNIEFNIWKYYFFFLWSMIEDFNGIFTKEINLQTELESQLKNGLNKFSKLAEFNFIAGYAVCIFPSKFGDSEKMDIKGKEMLKKAYEMKPTNSIYKMTYLGSHVLNEIGQDLYEKAYSESEQTLKTNYNGKGLLNEYFNEIFKFN